MKYLFYSLLLITSVSSRAQTLSSDQAHEDLLQLKSSIETYNPALEVYNPDFQSQATQLLNELPDDSVSLISFFKYASQLCALSNEGHFALGSWSDTVHSGFLQNRYTYLPISIKLIGGKMYLWIDNSMEQALERGDEVLAINGVKTADILKKLYQAYPADGQITTYVDRNLEQGFSWIYYLYVDQSDLFKIEARDQAGNSKLVEIEALVRDVQFENYDKYYPDHKPKSIDAANAFYRLEHENGVSYLTLPSFDRQRAEQYSIKSKKLYKSIFTEIESANSKYLVIDIRGNTGGLNEFADDMVPYINKGAEFNFLKKTISWEGKERVYKNPKSSKLAFTGKVYVLVDGRTYSAGNTLARYLKEYAKAEVIGEETGTRYEGFAAGSKQYVTLKNSGIGIGIPRYHILFPKSQRQTTTNRGLLPDHPIRPNVEDIMNGTDLHRVKAEKLIEDSED